MSAAYRASRLYPLSYTGAADMPLSGPLSAS